MRLSANASSSSASTCLAAVSKQLPRSSTAVSRMPAEKSAGDHAGHDSYLTRTPASPLQMIRVVVVLGVPDPVSSTFAPEWRRIEWERFGRVALLAGRSTFVCGSAVRLKSRAHLVAPALDPPAICPIPALSSHRREMEILRPWSCERDESASETLRPELTR